jgi:GAF domain/PilZ domain/Sel1 repeat
MLAHFPPYCAPGVGFLGTFSFFIPFFLHTFFSSRANIDARHFLCLMAATVSVSRSGLPNRRSRVRHKTHVPAYATVGSADSGRMLDLYEVLDLSERGVALQCALPVQVDQQLELCLDLAESSEPIYASGRVVWLRESRIGLSLPQLPIAAERQVKQWLFSNSLSAADDAEADPSVSGQFTNAAQPQNHTDLLAAASAVQREVEALGTNLSAAISIIALRCQSLLRASGAAIALEGKEAGSMICRASAGPSSPPTGLALEIGSGFSGECVRTGKLLRADDTETDQRVDIQTCRALGIRSMLAAPLRAGDRVVGLLEVFSPQPNAFSESDTAVLQNFTEIILAAFNRAAREYSPGDKVEPPAPPKPFTPPPGSVLFAAVPEEKKTKSEASSHESTGGIHLPRTHLFLLVAAAATIALALGFILAPWIQEQIQARHSGLRTVLASSKAPIEALIALPANSQTDASNLAQLRQLASQGDASAENTLGLLYITGDDKQQIKPDEKAAAEWFIKAAERGSVPAESKLGSLYWGGRGVQKDDTRAYFWTVLARASGDDASRVLAPFIATRLTSAQRKAIEEQAEQWLLGQESAKNSPN